MPTLFRMVFVRVKKVRGNKYGYAVANNWTLKGPRQRVVGYLGRVYQPEKKEKVSEFEEFVQKPLKKYLEISDYKNIIKDLIEFQLQNNEIPEEIEFDKENLTIKKGKKKVVIAINEGYLCDYTIKKLIDYDGEDATGFNLADLITAAGIKLNEEIFITLFSKKQKKEEPEFEQKEFYY